MISFKDQIADAFRKGVARKLEPRGNQVDAVVAVLMKLSSRGGNCLVQAAPGVGKSLTMALLAQQLIQTLKFDAVLLLTDRTTLDEQLGETCECFLENHGVNVIRINESDVSDSTYLLKALLNEAETWKPFVALTTVHWMLNFSAKCLHFHFEFAEGQKTKIHAKYQNTCKKCRLCR